MKAYVCFSQTHQESYILQLFSDLLKHSISLKALQTSRGASEHCLNLSATHTQRQTHAFSEHHANHHLYKLLYYTLDSAHLT